jgi:hypothetical protein
MVLIANNFVKGYAQPQRASVSSNIVMANIQENEVVKKPVKKTSTYIEHMTTVQKQ